MANTVTIEQFIYDNVKLQKFVLQIIVALINLFELKDDETGKSIKLGKMPVPENLVLLVNELKSTGNYYKLSDTLNEALGQVLDKIKAAQEVANSTNTSSSSSEDKNPS
jgi:hypothetical protein